MPRSRKRDIANPLSKANFPIIFEQGQPKAVVVDIQKYRELELFVDNLINLREEDEDAILTDSGMVERLVAKAKKELGTSRRHANWEDEIDAI